MVVNILLTLLLISPIIWKMIVGFVYWFDKDGEEQKADGVPEDSEALSQEEIRRTLYEAHRALDSRRIRGISAWIDSCMYRIETDRYLPVEMALFALEETANEMKMRGYDPEILVPAFIKLAGIAEPGGEA